MPQEAVTSFSDMGFNDPIAGAEIFNMLHIEAAELANPKTVEEFKLLTQFINSSPDALYLAKRALTKHLNPNTTPLEHLTGFVQLHSKRQELKKTLASLESEIGLYE